MKVNFENSQFFKNEVKYLGLLINSEGIRENPERVSRPPMPFTRPKVKKDIRSIVGLINWVRLFFTEIEY